VFLDPWVGATYYDAEVTRLGATDRGAEVLAVQRGFQRGRELGATDLGAELGAMDLGAEADS